MSQSILNVTNTNMAGIVADTNKCTSLENLHIFK